MSYQANDAANATGTTPGAFQSIDFLLNSAQRIAEGVIGFKLLNKEADAAAAQAQWKAAAYNQLYSQQIGNSASPWGGSGGVGGIQMPGLQAGMAGGAGGLLVPVAIGLGLAYLFFKK